MTELMQAIENLKVAAQEAEAEFELGAVGEEITALVLVTLGHVRSEHAALREIA